LIFELSVGIFYFCTNRLHNDCYLIFYIVYTASFSTSKNSKQNNDSMKWVCLHCTICCVSCSRDDFKSSVEKSSLYSRVFWLSLYIYVSLYSRVFWLLLYIYVSLYSRVFWLLLYIYVSLYSVFWLLQYIYVSL